jgi:hypothetical protein
VPNPSVKRVEVDTGDDQQTGSDETVTGMAPLDGPP